MPWPLNTPIKVAKYAVIVPIIKNIDSKKFKKVMIHIPEIGIFTPYADLPLIIFVFHVSVVFIIIHNIWSEIFFVLENISTQERLLFLLYIKCTVGQKQAKHPYLFNYKLSYRNETGTNHHGLLSTSIWCFKVLRTGPSTWGFST